MLRRRPGSGEEGFALPTVMGAIALITVIAMGGFFIAQDTLGESVRVSSENRAYQAASSGLEQEMSYFTSRNWPQPVSLSGYAYGTQQTINGSDWFRVTVSDSTQDPSLGAEDFEMVSVGGSQDESETVRLRFMSFNLWDMNVAGSENSNVGAGAGFNGNGRIIGKVYVNGNFDWSGNGSLEGGPIFVANGVFNKQSTGSNVGTVDDPLDAYFDNPPTGTTTNMYTDERGSAPKITVEWPDDAKMDEWREMSIQDAAFNKLGDGTVASHGLKHPGAVSVEQYTVFNGDLTLGGYDFGKPGPLITVNGFTDEPVSGDVIAVDNGGTTLHINGTVYVDGTLTFSGIRQYSGNGLLVARDGIVISSNSRLVPIAFNSSWETYDGERLPILTKTDCLGLASLGNVYQHNADWVAGAVFTAGNYIATPTGAKFRGSIIAQSIDFSQPNAWLVTQPGMVDILPRGLPQLNNMNAKGDWTRQ